MGFSQTNHEAGGPNVNLSADQADRLRDLFQGYRDNAATETDDDNEVAEALDNMIEAFGAVANGDDDAKIAPDTASTAAIYLRKREGEDGGEHESLLKALDSVAKQYDISGGHTTTEEVKTKGPLES